MTAVDYFFGSPRNKKARSELESTGAFTTSKRAVSAVEWARGTVPGVEAGTAVLQPRTIDQVTAVGRRPAFLPPVSAAKEHSGDGGVSSQRKWKKRDERAWNAATTVERMRQ